MSFTACVWIKGERWEMRDCGPGYKCENNDCDKEARNYLLAFEGGDIK